MVSNIFYFHPFLGKDPISLIFFRWVETTNQENFPKIHRISMDLHPWLPFVGRHLLRFGNQQWWMHALHQQWCLQSYEWYQLWHVALGAAVFVAWFWDKKWQKLVENWVLVVLVVLWGDFGRSVVWINFLMYQSLVLVWDCIAEISIACM